LGRLKKHPGGVIKTLLGFLLPSKASGADGVIPPGFQFPVKELVASLNIT